MGFKTYAIVTAVIVLGVLVYFGMPTPEDVSAWWKRIRGKA